MIKLFTFFSLTLLSLLAAAQEPRHYNFTHFTSESGLISYQVNSSLQDEDGYIWIGSNDGLQRYDGIRYINFLHKDDDPSSIPSKSVLQIIKDKKKNLWILTVDGNAGIFDTKTFTFHPVRVKVKNEAQLRATLTVKKLITDEYGNMFLLVEGKELVTYNEGKNEFSSAHNFILQKPGSSITDFIQQPGTLKYWICTKNNGLAIYNRAGNHLSYYSNNVENEKLIDLFKGITNPDNVFFDKQGRVWFADVGNGFANAYCYDLKTLQPVIDNYSFAIQVPGYHEIRQFFEQRDGTIWVSGVNILARFLEKEKQFEQVFNGYADDRSIDFVSITHVAEDRENNIWVGTGNNGLFRFNPSKEFFTNIKPINPSTRQYTNGSPTAFMNDPDGSILVGVWQEGLFRYDKNFKEIPLDIKGFPGNKIPAIIKMSKSITQDIVWMAAQEGIYKYNQATRRVQFYNPAALTNRTREMAEDRKGNLWIGMQENGVLKWDSKKANPVFENGFSRFTAIPPVKINKIMVDKKGYVWIGTFAEGAYVIDPDTDGVIMHFSSKGIDNKKIPEQTVTSILEYNDSLVMMSTSTMIVVYNRKQQSLSVLGNSEKTSGFISSMEKDDYGHLWVSTTAALYRVTVSSKIFVKFNRNDGIRNDFFIIAASLKLPDGRIMLGSTGTIVVFDPASINNINAAVPNCQITEFKVMNQSLRPDSLMKQKMVELGPDDNSITIDLSTLTFNSQYQIRYQLEGLDKEWRTADKTHELIYNYVPPGEYTLHVYTIDDKGKQGDTPLQLLIRINPPFWKTRWFYGTLLLLFAGLLFWLDRERMKRKEAMQKMRSDIANDLHEQLSSALGNINVLSEMARLKADKEPKKSKEFIEQIHTKSNNMIHSINDMLWNIDPENDGMSSSLDRIREHIEALRNQYGVQIDLLIDKNVDALKLNMKLRRDVFWFFKNGITNMVKGGAVNCRVHIRYEKSILLYTIEFDNSHIDDQQMNNLLQRQELDQRLKVTNAVLSRHVHKTTTLIELKIPVR